MEGTDQRDALARKMRSHFICKSYFVFIIFSLLSVAQYVLIMKIESLSNFVVDHIALVITCFFMALTLLTVFVFVENVRFVLPLNWCLALIIVEGFSFGVSRSMVNITPDVLYSCLVFVTVLMIFCISLAAFMSHDFTLDVIIIFVLSFIIFIASVYFVTLYVVADLEFSFYIYSGLVAFIFCLFLLYHVQTINGGRYAELRLTDYLLAALILYIDFTILLLISLYFASRLWELVTQPELDD